MAGSGKGRDAGRDRKEPLWRSVNTRTHHVRHGGGDARHQRNTKAGPQASMHAGARHGRDYTPLFRFLLSRVGQPWADIHAEAVSRLDDAQPIWWLVQPFRDPQRAVIRCGESSYFSGLYVDDDGRLQRIAPELGLEHLHPSCPCCTHTFNGQRFIHPWTDSAPLLPDPLPGFPADPDG